MNGQTLRKQYKEVISGFREWAEADHANEYLIFPDNIGENLSLDETSLSNGDVYTLLTNKAGKGKKGTLVAIIQGVSADNINKILRKIPYKHREKVKTITTDLSSAMMLIAKTTFPSATLINDRFHVQQLMNEAVDQLRIAYRWEVLERENEEIRQYREKRKAAISKEERDLIGKWVPKRYSNGETLPQILAKGRHILRKHKSKWNEQQQQRAQVLFEQFPRLEQAYGLCLKLTDVFNKRFKIGEARLALAKWYNEVEMFDCKEFNRVLNTFANYNDSILNYFIDRLINASAESFNAKIKAFRSQLRGVEDIKFFMFRIATQYA